MSFARNSSRTRPGGRKEPEAEVRITVSKVTKASEVPSYKNLPKYNHVALAVINPHSPTKRPPTAA